MVVFNGIRQIKKVSVQKFDQHNYLKGSEKKMYYIQTIYKKPLHLLPASLKL